MIRALRKWLERSIAASAEGKWSAEERREQLVLLESAAARLHAKLDRKRGRDVLTRDGIDVEVSIIHDRGAIGSIVWRTTVPFPGFPDFEIERYGTFVVVADPEVMDVLWTQERKNRLHRDLINLELWCENSRLQIRLHPAVLYQNVIDGAFELMYELIQADPYATALLRPLGRYHDIILPYVEVEGPGDIRVGYARDDRRIVTEVRAAVGVMSSDVEDRVRALGATSVICAGGELVARWPTALRDRDQLFGVIELIRQVATQSDGVFR